MSDTDTGIELPRTNDNVNTPVKTSDECSKDEYLKEMRIPNTAILPYSVVCKRFLVDVRCFNCLPQAVVAAETVAEFKRNLSNVDLSSF